MMVFLSPVTLSPLPPPFCNDDTVRKISLGKCGHVIDISLYASVAIMSGKFEATYCKHACFKLGAWFRSANTRVPMTDSKSIVSHNLVSQIARRRPRSTVRGNQ